MDAVIRRLILAFVLCAAAWAARAPIATPSIDDQPTTAATEKSLPTLTAAPRNTGDSESRWDVGIRSHVALTESLWRSAAVHADLAGARSGDACDATRIDRSDLLVRAGPSHQPLFALRI